jgi:hypothetical protein
MNTDTITLAVGSFADRARAQQAVDGLRRAGFREDQVAVICKKTQSLTDEIFAILSGIGLSHADGCQRSPSCATCRSSLWFNPSKGAAAGSGRIEPSGGTKQFKVPFEGDAVLYLKAQ